ncbi:aminotransferase [Lentinula raphanica]|uniref:Aminotransferase n=1 Tax=Lentinula raphanica TaxID=153919 RepID=A0AA38UE02_9AGAR|nr:aminotransferase [Lentinula raphanica]KAJ3838229.1 aminotransferase [Lentinula raphanica]
MYALLSSTRYDRSLENFEWNNDIDGPSSFFLLRYHFDRLLDASNQHGWQKAQRSLSYSQLKQKCREEVEREGQGHAHKVRITLSEEGEIEVTLSPVSPFERDPLGLAHIDPTSDLSRDEPIISVYLDTTPTTSSLFTHTKTTQRALYDEARVRAKIASPTSEVVLYNENLEITEASISNVSFFRAGRWTTPAESTGCLPGVIRRLLLEKNFIDEDHEKSLTKDTILEGDWVLLSNGVHGCRLGRITAVPFQQQKL